MTDSSIIRLSEIEAFARDGAVCLRQVISPTLLTSLRSACDEALLNPGPFHHIQSQPGDKGRFYTEYYVSRRLDAVKNSITSAGLAEIAGTLMNSQSIRFFFDGLFIKEPGTEKASQWHQDQPYYPVDGKQVAVVWLALDAIQKDYSLQLLRRSHVAGTRYRPVLFRNDESLITSDPSYQAVPDIDSHPEDFDLLSWDVEAGDCIVFNAMMLHGAAGNGSSSRRRALSTTWLGDDTVFASRPGVLEPHFRHLQYPECTPLTDRREFPLFWSRSDSSVC